MAEGRFVSRSISTNEQLATVSIEAALLFTWMIAHLDVDGSLAGSPMSIKANVVPLRDELTLKRIPKLLEELAAAVDDDGTSLVVWYEVGRQQVLFFPGFDGQQKGLRKDREAPSKLPPFSGDVKVLAGQIGRSQSAPEPPSLPRNSGPDSGATPENRSQVEVEVEVEGKGEVKSEGEVEVEVATTGDAPVVLVAAANRGIRERFGEQLSPIRHDAGSTHEAAADIAKSGIPIAFARDAIYTAAKECALDRAPRSLKYFVGSVKDRWRASQEYARANSSDARTLAPQASTARTVPSANVTEQRAAAEKEQERRDAAEFKRRQRLAIKWAREHPNEYEALRAEVTAAYSYRPDSDITRQAIEVELTSKCADRAAQNSGRISEVTA